MITGIKNQFGIGKLLSMISLYGDIPKEYVYQNIDDLIGQIFKLLPYKEENNECLDYLFTTLLFRISGLVKLFKNTPELLTVMSLLESARTESRFYLYRKAILDSCSLMKKIQEELDAGSV